jgi:hypothetical protein
MMLSGRNEMIAIGALILYIAFVPCPYAMKEFFGSAVGKALALGAVVYAWKFVSEPVALLVLVAFLRSGAIREFADDPSMIPMSGTDSEFKCADGFMFDTSSKQCKKGSETKMPECSDPAKTWNVERGVCVGKADPAPPAMSGSGSGGPSGGSTGSAAAMAAMEAEMPSEGTEKFTPYGGADTGFSPV